MKPVKFLVAALFAFALSFTAKAQYYYYDNPYAAGGTAWCLQMQSEISQMEYQRSMMAQEIINYYQQKAYNSAQALMNFQANPTVNTYTPAQTYHSVKVPCSHCDGGYNTRSVYMGSGNISEVRSRCGWCNGTGYVTEKVVN